VVSHNRGSSGLAITRGEVWLAALDPTTGSEIQKARPCLIASPPEMNQRLPTIIAVPMTTGRRPVPSRIHVRSKADWVSSCWRRCAASINAGLSGRLVP
jgi:mRNA-degrading endonuclease toxin of MazEF toxin-antitoxin module